MKDRTVVELVAGALLLLLLIIPVSAAPPKERPVRLMPVGDSITLGSAYIRGGGYRQALHKCLTDAGHLVDMVGSKQNGIGKWDRDHEGWGGMGTVWFAPRIQSFVHKSHPDLMLIMLGTNDVSGRWVSPKAAVQNMGRILDRIQVVAPNTIIMVSSIPPICAEAAEQRRLEFNSSLQAMILARHDPMVVYVDATRDMVREDMGDRVHPNEKGHRKIALAWCEAVRSLLEKD